MSYVTNQLFFLPFLLLLFSFEILLGSVTSAYPSTPFGSNHDCSGALFGFSDCLEFVEGGANAAGPNRGCCSGLGHVLSRSVTCLCEAIREGARLGVPVNATKALALPSLCGLSYTPISPCNKSPPNQSPASPPSMQPTTSPSTPPTSPFPAPSLPPTTSPSLPPFSPQGPFAPPPLSESPQSPLSPATSANPESGAIELGFSVMALVVAFVVALFSYLEF